MNTYKTAIVSLFCALAWAALPVWADSEAALESVQIRAQLPPSNLVVTTTLNVDGYRVRQYIGVIRGVTVRQPTISQHLKAGLKGMVGGKMSPYTSMCETARQQAYDILVQRAQSVGANAILGLRYDSSAFATDGDDMGTEVVCYGTACVIEPSK